MDKFDSRLALKIADTAHRKILDSAGQIGYGSNTNTWLEAMKEVLKGEGYELIIRSVSSDNTATTTSEMSTKEE